jgi:SAM-dependent methyltransferase
VSGGVDHKGRQKAQWGAAAHGWDRRFDWYATVFAPLASWCCVAADVGPGISLLDVACGTGLVTLPAARLAGTNGRVVAIDLSPDMISVVTRRARSENLETVEAHEMDAEDLQFDDRSFDAVTCACGLMFVPDAPRALQEMRRVLRSAGRVAVAVWDEPGKSPFLTLAGQAAAAISPPAPPAPGAPGGFRFSGPGELAALLREAGFAGVTAESLPLPIECASTAEYIEIISDMSAGMKARLSTLPPGDLARFRAHVDEAARQYQDEGRLRLVATALCASGTRP